jgi:hypothetical protein
LIDEGDELDLGNRLFKVLHMPGQIIDEYMAQTARG